ncbi:MAG: xanthine dehydrogenase family protein molybdopterin-binding subunit [Gammaproteobacteria bacterium]|jgi:isoquinoline 1-oxidoreductase subunit beta|nr:xanthine dehydrogenase family protein molybdopterin-binding subunit [Gammaproteobacteria bacterium]NBR16736.1 xanthine dehydrogenase family protein molybdopterin-binding subunit [Gammaproteobacteria bacterium]NCW20700.1 xanthine dehydrogenase family protein molybdopterin-binding subunit [Gammaproteobacteria bacterium]NCW56586.1 xanthine dehydrogenase family protein molybdopterin-binding subunit [Gammaproteobacteria bacterium]NDA42061.1 xanthine dehydrogenase family protein molybdopterin-bind
MNANLAQDGTSRRDLLKLGALAGGGLLLGIGLGGCSKPAALGGAGGQPVAWLRIGGDDSITVFVDKSEMGQGVYTALTQLLAEELGVALEAIRVEAAPVAPEYVNNLLGAQITGGSTSIRDGFEKLRKAGAQARTMLLQAAATHWGVAPGELRIDGGAVLHGKERLSYGALAEAAAKLPIPKEITLKPATEFTLVGKPAKRIDTAAKLDGSATYGIDVKLPGMLHGAIAQCPTLGGKLASFDGSAAEAMPGVKKIVGVGNGVVVVADHYWQARKALEAVKITWDPGANANLGSQGIRSRLRNAATREGRGVRADGDASAAIKTAAKVVRATYDLPLLAHATLEPQCCTADVRTDGADIHAPTQTQTIAQATAAAAAGLKPEQVKIHTTLLGGGFGRRLEVDVIPAAVLASKAVGKPVKVIWSREEDTTHDTYRPPAHDEVVGAFDASGKLVAWKLDLTGPSITARMFPPVVATAVDPFAVEAAANFPYDVPNVAVNYNREEIGIDVGYWRSVSHALNCFVAESFIDELAHAAAQDPYAFRSGLLRKQPRFKRVLDEAASRAGWGKAPAGHHQGIALMEGYGTYMAQVVEISMRGNQLAIHRITCAVDCGQMVNPNIVDQQVEGSILFGLTAALWGEITLAKGQVQQRNFDSYRMLRLPEAPRIDVHLLASGEAPGGIGEPGTAVVGPALANAIFAATGKRLRSLPIAKSGIVTA